MAHETIKYGLNDVPELFNTCFIKGTIIAVNEFNNSADISTAEFGTLYGVPIFYHCPDSSDTSNGWNAFEEDDEVVVIVPNAVNNLAPNPNKIKIVGFWDNQPRPCIGEGFFVARAGNWIVVWDIAKRQYAKGIIDDYDQEVLSWPKNINDLDDWYALTFQIGETGIGQWGGSDLWQQFVTCGFTTSPNCVLRSDNKYAENTVYILGEGGDPVDDHCESTRWSCNQTVRTEYCDPPNETDKKEEEVNIRNQRTTGGGLAGLDKAWTGSNLWGTYNATVNGVTIQIAGVSGGGNDEGDETTIISYYSCPGEVPAGWECEYFSWQYSDFIGEVHTPWGKMFEDVAMVDRFLEYTGDKSGGGSYTGCEIDACTGYSKVALLNNPVRDTRYARRFYQEAVGGFSEGNALGVFIVGFCKQAYYTYGTCSPVQGDDIKQLDAIGVIGFYEDNTTIDLTAETETPDVREGLINLVEAYHDDVGDFSSIQTFRVYHRKYLTDL